MKLWKPLSAQRFLRSVEDYQELACRGDVGLASVAAVHCHLRKLRWATFIPTCWVRPAESVRIAVARCLTTNVIVKACRTRLRLSWLGSQLSRTIPEAFRWGFRTCLLFRRGDGPPAVNLNALNTWFCLPGGALQKFPGHSEPMRVIDIILNAMRRSQLPAVIC